MTTAILLTLLIGQTQADAPGAGAKAQTEGRSQKLLALHREDAATYGIFLDGGRTQKAELKPEPIYRWTNPTRNGGQEGDVFLWKSHGLPQAVGCIFSHPEGEGRRNICHEFHALSETTLVVDHPGPNQWKPEAEGVTFLPVPDAPAPATTAPARLRQMNAIAREFSGNSESEQGKTWEMRLLPRPLDRFESTDPNVLDGAMFGLVTNAGTDPEILLILEARKTKGGDAPRWEFAAARFSDMALWLKYRNREVWSSPEPVPFRVGRDEKERYRLFKDRDVDEIVPVLGGSR